jgi:hypothetical protein
MAIESISGSVRAGFGGSVGCRRLPRLRALRFRHLSDEAEALARQCFDEAMFLARISDRAPGYIQAGRHRRIGDAAPVPNGVD